MPVTEKNGRKLKRRGYSVAPKIWTVEKTKKKSPFGRSNMMCESLTMIKFVFVWQDRFCTKVQCIAAGVSEAPPHHVASSHKPTDERRPSTTQEAEAGQRGSDSTLVEPRRAGIAPAAHSARAHRFHQLGAFPEGE